MTDDRVRVYARIRPRGTSREEFGDAAVRCIGENGVAVDDLEGAVNDSLRTSAQGGVAAAAATRKFEFDGSFGGSSTQADVFSDVGAPVVRAVLQGYHGCVFAYGQTGSGKTHSMIGTPEEIIARIKYYQELGVDEFSFWCDNSLPHAEKKKSLELFIKEVVPAFA